MSLSLCWLLIEKGTAVTETEQALEANKGTSISLDIPSRPEYLSLGRLVAGRLGLQMGWEEEDIADLKLVVSEVCSFFLTSSDPVKAPSDETDVRESESSLRLSLDVTHHDWTLTVRNPDLALRLPQGAFCDPHSERSLGLTVVEAVADSVECRDDESEGTVFRLHKHLSPFEGPEG